MHMENHTAAYACLSKGATSAPGLPECNAHLVHRCTDGLWKTKIIEGRRVGARSDGGIMHLLMKRGALRELHAGLAGVCMRQGALREGGCG